jgi:hypothetical protein
MATYSSMLDKQQMAKMNHLFLKMDRELIAQQVVTNWLEK